jgi:anti-anti-sigma factor
MEDTPFTTMSVVESATLVVFGCVDHTDVEAFRASLREASRDFQRDLTVDLSEVEFFPSQAVGVLVGARNAASRNGTTLELVARDGTLARRVLNICGIPVNEPLAVEPQT